MTKRKISAMVSPEQIRRAQGVTDNDNLSDLIEQGLEALIERELERRWVAGYERQPAGMTYPMKCPSISARSHGSHSCEHGQAAWWGGAVADVPGDKVRPVLVLTWERFIGRLRSVLVARSPRQFGIPTEVALGPNDGLPQPCAANFDNLFTLRRERLREPIARLSDDHLHQVCQAYRFAAGC